MSKPAEQERSMNDRIQPDAAARFLRGRAIFSLASASGWFTLSGFEPGLIDWE